MVYFSYLGLWMTKTVIMLFPMLVAACAMIYGLCPGCGPFFYNL